MQERLAALIQTQREAALKNKTAGWIANNQALAGALGGTAFGLAAGYPAGRSSGRKKGYAQGQDDAIELAPYISKTPSHWPAGDRALAAEEMKSGRDGGDLPEWAIDVHGEKPKTAAKLANTADELTLKLPKKLLLPAALLGGGFILGRHIFPKKDNGPKIDTGGYGGGYGGGL